MHTGYLAREPHPTSLAIATLRQSLQNSNTFAATVAVGLTRAVWQVTTTPHPAFVAGALLKRLVASTVVTTRYAQQTRARPGLTCAPRPAQPGRGGVGTAIAHPC